MVKTVIKIAIEFNSLPNQEGKGRELVGKLMETIGKVIASYEYEQYDDVLRDSMITVWYAKKKDFATKN